MALLNKDKLRALPKREIPQLASNLTRSDVSFLVQALSEKEDTTRYNAFLLLQLNSRLFPYTYEYWNELEKKLNDTNSYQRSIGLMLIAENVGWDKDGNFGKTLSQYLKGCLDEKFITARQAIQGLARILGSTDKYDDRIRQGLIHLSFARYKGNQQKLLRKDVANILKIIETDRVQIEKPEKT